MTSNFAPWAGPLIRAHRMIREALAAGTIDPAALAVDLTLSANPHTDQGYSHNINLQAAALLLDWIAGRTLGAIDADSSLADASQWATGDQPVNTQLLACIQTLETDPLSELRPLEFGPTSCDVLPYLLETLETGDEAILRRGRSRDGKRSSGIYYTPSDVANFVCGEVRRVRELQTSSKQDSLPRWLDPACGTGVFLRSALDLERSVRGIAPGHDTFSFAQSALFGIDISPFAVQSCIYILTIQSYLGSEQYPASLRNQIQALSANFKVCDAAEMHRDHRAPENIIRGLTARPHFIVSNPPYVGRKQHNSKQTTLFEDSRPTRGRGNIYTDFARMLLDWLDSSGSGAMILPLSISFSSNKEMVDLRSDLFRARGRLAVAHFDRTPDSLFGDDVKTRNAILFFSPAHRDCVLTTPLMRWTSRSRPDLFDSLQFTPAPDDCHCIPKIGSQLERKILESLLASDFGLLGGILADASTLRVREHKDRLFQKPTAYNWLPFRPERIDSSTTAPSKNEYEWFVNTSVVGTFSVFAITQSRIAYWFWRVMGDGFHLTRSFVRNFPFDPSHFSDESRRALENLGLRLWDAMSRAPTVKRNAGHTSATYSPYNAAEIVSDIDALLMRELGLPSDTPDFLAKYVQKVILVGREDELACAPHLRQRIGYGRNISVGSY